MTDILDAGQFLLHEAGMNTRPSDSITCEAIVFEGRTVLGFIQIYPSASDLLARWADDARELIDRYQLALRRAEAKAWNTYSVLLCREEASYAESVHLGAIEEDLAGTRKIARAGIKGTEALRGALLPLLPIQNAPRLEAVDMREEIRLRTTELPSGAVEAFISGVSDKAVVQMLEEAP